MAKVNWGRGAQSLGSSMMGYAGMRMDQDQQEKARQQALQDRMALADYEAGLLSQAADDALQREQEWLNFKDPLLPMPNVQMPAGVGISMTPQDIYPPEVAGMQAPRDSDLNAALALREQMTLRAAGKPPVQPDYLPTGMSMDSIVTPGEEALFGQDYGSAVAAKVNEMVSMGYPNTPQTMQAAEDIVRNSGQFVPDFGPVGYEAGTGQMYDPDFYQPVESGRNWPMSMWDKSTTIQVEPIPGLKGKNKEWQKAHPPQSVEDYYNETIAPEVAKGTVKLKDIERWAESLGISFDEVQSLMRANGSRMVTTPQTGGAAADDFEDFN